MNLLDVDPVVIYFLTEQKSWRDPHFKTKCKWKCLCKTAFWTKNLWAEKWNADVHFHTDKHAVWHQRITDPKNKLINNFQIYLAKIFSESSVINLWKCGYHTYRENPIPRMPVSWRNSPLSIITVNKDGASFRTAGLELALHQSSSLIVHSQ